MKIQINSIARVFSINALLIVLLGISTIGGLWLYDVYSRSKRELLEVEKNVIEESKKTIQNDIQNLVYFIDKRREFFHKNALDLIKSQTLEAHELATKLYSQYKDKMSLQEVKNLVREVLRHKRYNNGRGYFFATNLNGIEELFADRPQLEGKNLLDLRDTRGNFVIKDMIKIARTKKEGFYEYYWTKPGASGSDHKKISYIKYFEPFDWFIGTGEYYEDLEQDIKKELMSFLNDKNISLGNYIFALDYEGNCLTHIKKELIGKNLIDLKDKDGIFFIKELIKIAKTTKGDFIRYYFEKPEGGKDALPKISYVTNYEPWQVIIGSGFYIEDLDSIMKHRKLNIQRDIFNKTQIIFITMTSMLLIMFIINKHFLNKLNDGFKVFHSFFKRAAENKELIDLDKLYFKEFKDLAIEANHMTDRRVVAELSLEEISNEYKTLFDNMLDGFAIHRMIFDKDGKPKDYRYLSVNKAFEKIVGIKAKDIIGKTVLEVMPETEYYWIEAFGNVVITGEPIHLENYSRSLGKYFEVTAYKYGEDKFACTFLDITERVLMYKSLEELTRNLEEKVNEEVERRRKNELMLIQQSKLASMAEMLISISHHWRQPLNAIGLIVQSIENLYENNQLTEEKIHWIIDTVMERVTSMSNTINSFSSYFDKITITDTFDIESVLQRTFNIISEDFNINKIKLSLSFADSPRGQIHPLSYNNYHFVVGDVNNFQQVMLALLTNSKEAIIERQQKENGNGEYFVHITLKSTPSNIIINIEDNGGGINPDIMDRIFEPYFTTKEKSFTVGLGLYMAKMIIEEQFKGRLYCENTDEGVIFTIELPKKEETD